MVAVTSAPFGCCVYTKFHFKAVINAAVFQALSGVDKVGDFINLKYAKSKLKPEDLVEVVY